MTTDKGAFVYILESERNGRYYIGWTGDVELRLAAHNAGLVKATRSMRPWVVVYTESHETATSARKREWQLKRLKSRVLLERLISAD